MKLFNNLEKQHYFLLAGWLLINILQSFFTNLHPDETYYWMYSKQLDWGYFDHPPMTAFLVFLGDSIIHNGLGVRLFMVLLSLLTMAMIMNELNEKKDLFFLVVFIASFPLVHTHIGGFLALPDTPLVFFTLLFFLTYKRFVAEPNLKLALLLAFVVAAMIYSKYHALLVIGIVVLSNFNLLKNRYFWVVVSGTLILLIPHILWQVENHFPTFAYHLTDRTKPVQIRNIANNIFSQLAIAGPLSGVIVLYSLLKVKTKHNPYNRAMLFSILGFYSLFFIMSFWNRIEAHWTTATTPLLMILSYPIISDNQNAKKWFKRLSIPIVVLFFMFRFYMAADFIPNTGFLKFYFYKQEEKAIAIKKMAGDRKVASFNNFDFPGTYEFYTGDPVIHLATPGYRFCQFDLWEHEKLGEGDSLFIVKPDGMDPTELIILPNGQRIIITKIPKFQSLKQLTLETKNISKEINNLTLAIDLTNRSDHTIELNHLTIPSIGCLQHKKEFGVIPLNELTQKAQILTNETFSVKYKIPYQLVDTTSSFVVFIKSVEKYRGEMIRVDIADYNKKISN